MLAFQCKAIGLPAPVRELQFYPSRKWRADLAWPDYRLLVEYEGGVYINGRHTRGRGFENDCDKYNTATLEGWRVMRFTKKHVKSGLAVDFISRALANAR